MTRTRIITDAMPVQEFGEGQPAGAVGILLMRKAECDGFRRGFESNQLAGCLVSGFVDGLVGSFTHTEVSTEQ